MMENGIFFSIISFFYCIFVTILFFLKKKIKNNETKLYGILLIITLIGLFLEVVPTTMAIRGVISCPKSFTLFLLRIILVYLLVWLSLFTYYIFSLSVVDTRKLNILKISGAGILVFCCFMGMSLPLIII